VRALGENSRLAAARGLVLYLLTLGVDTIVAGPVRWAIAYSAAVVGGTALALPDPWLLGWLAALGPVAWSLLAIVMPSPGALWRRRLGARRPSSSESEALGEAMVLLRSCDQGLREPAGWHVLDDPQVSGVVRGRAMILSRGLLESDALAPVLAHELAHLDSLDGPLTEALSRLCLLPPRLRRAGSRVGMDHEPAFDGRELSGGWLRRLVCLLIRVGCGGAGEWLLGALWAAHWRAREYAADAYAAALGQAEDLARYLGEQEMPFDIAVSHLIASPAVHPPTALRLERLHEAVAG
jgi:Zn-dependent protease with chaperone function